MRTSSAARRFVTWAPPAAVLTVLLPALAAAQEPVKSFDQLNTRLRVGDTVWVTDARGQEIKGRITSLAPETLAVDADGGRTLRADEVRAVWNRRHDSLIDGTLVGAAVGFAAGAALTYAACSSDECSWGTGAAMALLVTAAGAGIGAGVDAAIPGRRQVVYRSDGAAGSARMSLAPFITRRATGVAVAISF